MQRINYNSIKLLEFIDKLNPRHSGVFFSVLIHLTILIFAVGLPNFFFQKDINVPNIIPIQILNISDSNNIQDSKNKDETKQKVSPKEKKFNSSDNIIPPTKNISEKSDNLVIEQKDEIIKVKEKSNTIINKEPEIKKVEKIDLKPKIETIKTDKIKPKIKPKPKSQESTSVKSDLEIEPKIKQENKNVKADLKDKPKPKDEDDFNKMLATTQKDLRNDINNNISKDEKETNEESNESGDDNNEANNAELSLTLATAAMQQLQGCVSIDSGQLRGYVSNEDQFIKTQAKYEKNGNIVPKSIRIVDININYTISKYIESRVIFALNTCNLVLPEEHYDLWKTITMTWDVDKILNIKKESFNLF